MEANVDNGRLRSLNRQEHEGIPCGRPTWVIDPRQPLGSSLTAQESGGEPPLSIPDWLWMSTHLGIVFRAMTKTLLAEYDAFENSLRLMEKIPELRDHEKVRVVIEVDSEEADRPWLALRGTLSVEAGDSLAASIERLFGRDS